MEKWLVDKVKGARSQYVAESWMLVAKTMVSGAAGFEIDIAGYFLHVDNRKAQEAAEVLTKIQSQYAKEPRFWAEAERLVASLLSNETDSDVQFRKAIFKQLSADMQEKLMLELAERHANTDFACKVMLLLVRTFPNRVQSFGNELIDLLQNLAESSGDVVDNKYALALVCEVTPIVLASTTLNLTSERCTTLLGLTIRLATYLSINETSSENTDQSFVSGAKLASFRSDPWSRSVSVFSSVVDRLHWHLKPPAELSLTSARKAIETMGKSKDDSDKYLGVLLMAWLFTQCYAMLCKSYSSYPTLVLVSPDQSEANELASETAQPEKAVPMKKRRYAAEPVKTLDFGLVASDAVKQVFDLGANCLSKADAATVRELVLPASRFADLHRFETDCLILAGNYDDAMERLRNTAETSSSLLQMASCSLGQQKIGKSCEQAILAVQAEKQQNGDGDDQALTSSKRLSPSTSHAAFIDQSQTLSYACRLVMYSIRCKMAAKSDVSDQILAPLIVLSQFDWDVQGLSLFKTVLALVKKNKSLSYPNLLLYITNVDILEEISFISLHCDGFKLQLTETEGERRIGLNTRHSVKGAKDGIKQALETQLTRTNDPIQRAIRAFLLAERDPIVAVVND